ncbi:MAG: phosphatidylglycerophosphatase A [Verrucomicrobia bacterium]|nr:phosphatidylglycerophosphatase A [Verrucomicrobiota bacterium]
MNSLALWIAQGFGLGRFPVAPGTFGSVGGIVWFIVLLSSPSPQLFCAGLAGGILVSVITGSMAEGILGKKDPGSVVIDEIVSVPLCFAGWLAIASFEEGRWLGFRFTAGSQFWFKALGVFVLFRFFDIVKPWPARQIQSLPGGWGITVDDLAAAAYVNICVLGILWGARLIGAEN